MTRVPLAFQSNPSTARVPLRSSAAQKLQARHAGRARVPGRPRHAACPYRSAFKYQRPRQNWRRGAGARVSPAARPSRGCSCSEVTPETRPHKPGRGVSPSPGTRGGLTSLLHFTNIQPGTCFPLPTEILFLRNKSDGKGRDRQTERQLHRNRL